MALERDPRDCILVSVCIVAVETRERDRRLPYIPNTALGGSRGGVIIIVKVSSS